MMKNIFKTGGFILCCLFLSHASFAQKFGYLNSAAVLSFMPEVAQAEKTLEVSSKKYQEKGQKMVEELQQKYIEIQKKEQEGVLSPKQLETEASALREKEKEIGAYEQEFAEKMQAKRNELYGPILERVNTAIQEVASENGYQFIFDGSPNTGVLLYADDSVNVTKQVMDKLGITPPTKAEGEAQTTPEVKDKN